LRTQLLYIAEGFLVFAHPPPTTPSFCKSSTIGRTSRSSSPHTGWASVRNKAAMTHCSRPQSRGRHPWIRWRCNSRALLATARQLPVHKATRFHLLHKVPQVRRPLCTPVHHPHGLIDDHEGTRQHTHSCVGTGRCAGVCSSPGGKGDQRLPHSCNGLQTVLKKVSNVVQGHWYQGSRCKGARKVQVVCGALAVSVDAGRTSKCTSISATPGSE
jgi:hypothetical protein